MDLTRLFMMILAGLGLLLALAALLLFLFQRKLLYPSPRGWIPDRLPANVERIVLDNGSFGLLIRPARPPGSRAPLMIFTHGNAETAYQWLEGMQALTDAGLAVFLLEFPGYADAAGRSSRASILQTVLQAYDRLSRRPEIDARHIIAYGRSIGGAAAAMLAAHRPVAALCLESTFSSLARLVREKGYPAFLLRDRYDNLAVIRRLRIPVWIFHGTEDELIPVSHARDMAQAAIDAELHTAPCGHNTCDRPWKALLAFLRKHQIVKD